MLVGLFNPRRITSGLQDTFPLPTSAPIDPLDGVAKSARASKKLEAAFGTIKC
jgi:hypothetical protein